MPLLRLQTSVAVPRDLRDKLLSRLSAKVAGTLGKPEGYMMVIVDDNKLMVMGGSGDPAAFAEIRSVGKISKSQIAELSKLICEGLGEALVIDPKRIYVNFAGVDGAHWGYNGGTFG